MDNWTQPQPRPHCISRAPAPPRTCEEVPAVFLQFLRLRIQAAAAAARSRGQPLAQGLEGGAALGGAEDHDGVVLHVVETLDGRRGDVQECVLVLGHGVV